MTRRRGAGRTGWGRADGSPGHRCARHCRALGRDHAPGRRRSGRVPGSHHQPRHAAGMRHGRPCHPRRIGIGGELCPERPGAFRAFYNGLNNTGSGSALSSSPQCRLPFAGASDPRKHIRRLTPRRSARIFNPYINTNYDPGGSTNWEDSSASADISCPGRARRDRTSPCSSPTATRTRSSRIRLPTGRHVPAGDANVTRTSRAQGAPGRGRRDRRRREHDGQESRRFQRERLKARDRTSWPSRSAVVSPAPGHSSASSTFLGPCADDRPGVHSTDRCVPGPELRGARGGLRELAFAFCAPVVNVEKLIDLTPDPGSR